MDRSQGKLVHLFSQLSSVDLFGLRSDLSECRSRFKLWRVLSCGSSFLIVLPLLLFLPHLLLDLDRHRHLLHINLVPAVYHPVMPRDGKRWPQRPLRVC